MKTLKMEGFNMQQTQQGIIIVLSPQNYRIVSMRENWNGGKNSFYVKMAMLCHNSLSCAVVT